MKTIKCNNCHKDIETIVWVDKTYESYLFERNGDKLTLAPGKFLDSESLDQICPKCEGHLDLNGFSIDFI